MTTSFFISIVLPTYNGASGYLEQAIKSCLHQTYTNWELIIVDDASTDDTPLLIARFMKEDSRIKYIRHKTNRKLPAALNTGFSMAKGNYFSWTSDDNCYRPNALKEMVIFLETHVEIDLVYTDYSVINEGGQLLKKVSVSDPVCLLRGNPIGPCFLHRSRVYKEVGGYSKNLFLAEDYDFWLRASICFRFHPLHKDLYIYRSHDNSLTSEYNDRVKLAAERALARNLPHLKWANRIDKAETYLRLARERRQNARVKLTFALQSALHSPGNFVRKLITKLDRNDLTR